MTAMSASHRRSDGRPPVGPRVKADPVEMSAADRSWMEPWEWLRNDRAALTALLEAEAAHAETALGDLMPLARQVGSTLASEVIAAELPGPQPAGAWWYLTRFTPGHDYPTLLRAPRQPGQSPDQISEDDLELVLDLNQQLAGSSCGIGTIAVGSAGRWAGWCEDPDGAERYRVRIAPVGCTDPSRTLTLGFDASDGADSVTGSILFGPNDETVFTVAVDALGRPCRLLRYHLPSDRSVATAGEPSVVADEPSAGRRLRVHSTANGRHLIIESASRTDGHYALLDLDHDAEQGATALALPPGARQMSIEIATVGGHPTAIATAIGDETPNGALWTASLHGDDGLIAAGASGWKLAHPHDDRARLSPPLATATAVVIGARKDGLGRVLIGRTDRDQLSLAPVAGLGAGSITFASAPQWDDEELHLSRTWWTRTPEQFRVPLTASSDDASQTHPEPPPGDRPGPDTDHPYVEEQLTATAADGTEIPVTVVRRADSTAPAPCILAGYGAYETVHSPSYNALLTAMLDLGMVWAFAHVRGGGERGARWHDAARGLGKPRSFSDYIACADELVHSGLVAKGRIVGMGASAGGLLVGRALTLAPDRFAGVALDAPFVDPLVTMLNPDLPLTINDRPEWGDPVADPQIAECMRSYAPTQTVTDTDYPPVLIIAGRHDTRVSILESVKFAQRLRAASGTPEAVTLFPHEAGHTGAPTVAEKLVLSTLQYLWAAKTLGLDVGSLVGTTE